MKIKKELISREIAGERFLVPVGKTVYDSNGLFLLTEVGAFIWDLIPEAQDPEALVSAVLNAYEVDEATVRADIDAFLAKLTELDII